MTTAVFVFLGGVCPEERGDDHDPPSRTDASTRTHAITEERERRTDAITLPLGSLRAAAKNTESSMAKREYDLVVFGATGFTGREVCFHLAELHSLRAPVRWAVAGRCRAKLLTLCEEIERLSTRGEWCFDQALSLPDGILVGDVEDEATLRSEVTAKTRCLLNCTGPYRFLGEPVVAACIATGTDYLDLCGEPEFMDRIFLKYHAAAEAASVFVVHACAFDSVPADLGVLFTATEAFCSPAICTSIESYLTVTSGAAGMAGHVTTFAAAVHGFGSVKQLALLRRQIQASAPPRPAPIGGAQALHPRRPVPWFWSNVARQYALKFPGADAAVVRNSQRGLLALAHSHADPMVLHAVRRKIPQYSAYFTVGRSLWSCVKTVVIGGVFSFLAAREWGRKLLLRCHSLSEC